MAFSADDTVPWQLWALIVAIAMTILVICLVLAGVYGQFIYGNWRCGMPEVECRLVIPLDGEDGGTRLP